MVRYNDFKVFKECEKNFSYNQSLTFYNAPSSHFNTTLFFMIMVYVLGLIKR